MNMMMFSIQGIKSLEVSLLYSVLYDFVSGQMTFRKSFCLNVHQRVLDLIRGREHGKSRNTLSFKLLALDLSTL